MNPSVAIVQMVSGQDVGGNLKEARSLIAEVANADMVFLPENFAALGNAEARAIGETEADSKGPIRSFLAEMAQTHDVWIVGGTLPTVTRPDGSRVDEPRVRAACIVVDNEGLEVARYDKIHMFDVEVRDAHGHYMESDTFEPGEHLQLVDTGLGRLGLSVCYDVRFPELYRVLFANGAELISIPSAFTEVTGAAHWRTLARARAVENFCYVIGSCQGGHHDSGRKTWGESLIVDPWGEVVASIDKGPGTATAEIDLERLKRIRCDMPVDKQIRFKSTHGAAIASPGDSKQETANS